MVEKNLLVLPFLLVIHTRLMYNNNIIHYDMTKMYNLPSHILHHSRLKTPGVEYFRSIFLIIY